jgi:hypothetical protein
MLVVNIPPATTVVSNKIRRNISFLNLIDILQDFRIQWHFDNVKGRDKNPSHIPSVDLCQVWYLCIVDGYK